MCLFLFFSVFLGRGVTHAMPWMQAAVVLVTGSGRAIKPTKDEPRD